MKDPKEMAAPKPSAEQSLLAALEEIKAELAAINTTLHLILALHLPGGPPPTTLVGDRFEHAQKLAAETHAQAKR